MKAFPTPRIGLRLVLTVWVVYAAHATTNVVRETYLAVAIAERLTVRVDSYIGLHPDLFEIPGRGAFINSNPGASLLGAVPYALALPVAEVAYRHWPQLVAPKPAAAYADPRPNRTRFMNEMRTRGLDIRLAVAALVMQVGLMAPLAALLVLALYRYLARRLGEDREALWLALAYAFATPVFFRSAFLNQNVLLAHAVLGAWLVLRWPGDRPRWRPRWVLAGFLLGWGLLLDYSAVPLAVAFGGWALAEGWSRAGPRGALSGGGACLIGAALPVLVLLAYQAAAFGSPWFPAQRYMPATEFSVLGWNGMTWPSFDLLWRNLADPRYGLLAFSPLLALALGAPFLARERGAPSRTELWAALTAVALLWLFNSANQFANLQWNTGVRYMLPAVPLLFLLAVPVLLALPPAVRWTVVGISFLVSWAVSMWRESVPDSLGLLVTEGPTLPVLVVLRRTAEAYAPWLAGGLQPVGALAVGAVALVVALLWWTPPTGRRAMHA